MKRIAPSTLARALLSFWALWFSVVSASNAADALRESGLVSPALRFNSRNFALVADAISLYSLSRTWAAALFALVLLGQLAASLLFWRAALLENPLAARVHLAPFCAGIGLFCAFLVSDEVLLVYRRFAGLETTHFAVLSSLLLSLLLVHLLGDREPSE
jgi:hypothetical protein